MTQAHRRAGGSPARRRELAALSLSGHAGCVLLVDDTMESPSEESNLHPRDAPREPPNTEGDDVAIEKPAREMRPAKSS